MKGPKGKRKLFLLGSMNLRNIHNVTYVAVYEQGDVKMTGLDGDANIFVKKVF